MKTFKALGAAALLSTSLLGAVTSFAADYEANPSETKTPVKATFTLPEDGSDNNKPENPDNGPEPTDPDNPGNKPNNPTGPFGIAYQPLLWDINETQLEDHGEQSIKFKSQDPRVGVKDKTRETFGWNLTAALSWDGAELPGASITTENTAGTVTNNMSTEKNPNDYQPVNGEVTGASDLVIEKEPTVVMTGVKGKQHSGTYDYALTNASLKIADTTKVTAGSYAGNVTWNLAKAEV